MSFVRWVVSYVPEINESYDSIRKTLFVVEEIQNTNCDTDTTASFTIRRNLIDATSTLEIRRLRLSTDVYKPLLLKYDANHSKKVCFNEYNATWNDIQQWVVRIEV